MFDLGKSLFAMERYDPKTEDRISCIFNISDHSQMLKLAVEGKDLIGGEVFNGQMRLRPWQVVWIKHKLKAPERLGRLRRWRMKLIKRTKRYTIGIKRTMR